MKTVALAFVAVSIAALFVAEIAQTVASLI